jgi:phosphatidate cytidylyltransferase
MAGSGKGDLAKRLATAAVLVPIVIAAIEYDPSALSVLVLAIAVGVTATDEFLRMALPVDASDRAVGLRVVVAILAASIISVPTLWDDARSIAPLLALSAVAIGFTVLARKPHLHQAGRHFGIALAGLVYIPVLVSTLPLLKREGQPGWLLVVLCMAFFSDTVAYFCGRAFGRHKLYPAVSPKKTWEGSIGGIVGSTLATVGIGSLWLVPTLQITHAIALGVLGSVVGQAGDLVESMIKRTYDVKDSGRLLPGHGGMLDRVDALLFVTPLVYYYVAITG